MPITQSRSPPASRACASSTTRSARCSHRRRPSCAARAGRAPAGGTLVAAACRIARPFHAESIFGFLGDRAVPGVETWDGATYRRSLRLNHGNAVIAVSPGPSSPGSQRGDVHPAARQRGRRAGRRPALPPAARPRRRSRHDRRALRRRPDPRAARSQATRPAVAGPSRRRRTARPERCSVSRCPSTGRARSPADSSPRSASRWQSPSTASPTRSRPRSDRRLRDRATSRCPRPGARTDRTPASSWPTGGIVIDAGSDRDEIVPQLESLAGHRPVDRQLRGAAGARRSRRVPADRHRCAQRARAPRCRLVRRRTPLRRCRIVATVAVVRAAPPLGEAVRDIS